MSKASNNGKGVINRQCVLPQCWSPNRHLMPPLIVEWRASSVAHAHCTVSQVENVVDPPIHKLYCYEILALSSIVQKKTVQLFRFEL